MMTIVRSLAEAAGWIAVALRYWLVMTGGDIGPDRPIVFLAWLARPSVTVTS